jgi:putative tryptophan/tyrosine transport system substrate-binding protein
VSQLPTRRRLLVIAGVLFAAPIAAFAQRAKVVRIGVLVAPSAADFAARTDALRSGLAVLGYVDGRNALFEIRSADGKSERLPQLATELVQLNVDVIVAAGTPAIRAAKQATTTIPIVIAAVGDAVGGGIVTELARPGGNITGSTYFAPELATKQLELLKEVFPQVSQIAVIFNPGNPAAASTLRALDPPAKSLTLELRPFAVTQPLDFATTFMTIAKNGYRAVLVIDDPITISNARALADLALKYRLATAGNFIEYAEAGGLMAYGVDLIALWRRSAFFVDRILKGASPAEIPVERATRFELVINRKTAKALEVDLPASMLLRADRILE